MTFSEYQDRIFSDGCSMDWCIKLADGSEVWLKDIVRKRSTHCSGTYPFASYAAGVSPSQVPQMKILDRANGVPTEYTGGGDPIFTSKGHRKRYLETHNMHDRNAGYSDPAPA
jgi:hypothetical protein